MHTSVAATGTLEACYALVKVVVQSANFGVNDMREAMGREMC